QRALKIGELVKIDNSAHAHYGIIASLNPLKARIGDKIAQNLRGKRITIISRKNVPEQFLKILNA
ncbi:MAG: hypothetical protein ACTSUT_17740, partial [Promethearchaeota archaeon]